MEALRTPEKDVAFLAALMETCSVSHACKAVRIGRTTAYQWRAADPVFAKRWDEAKRLGAEALEDEGIRRGREGVDEPVFHQGEVCGTVRRYSDTLLIFLLKGAMPEKYRDNAKVELAGRLDVRSLSDAELDAALVEVAAKLGTPLPALNTPDDGSDLV